DQPLFLGAVHPISTERLVNRECTRATALELVIAVDEGTPEPCCEEGTDWGLPARHRAYQRDVLSKCRFHARLLTRAEALTGTLTSWPVRSKGSRRTRGR